MMQSADSHRRLVATSLIISCIITVIVLATTSVQCVDATPRFPFLSDDKPETVCANVLHYTVPNARTTSTKDRSVISDENPDEDGEEDADGEEEEGEENSTGDVIRPVAIVTNATMYTPGQALQVTVSSTEGFRGFLLQARRYGLATVAGQFVVDSPISVDVQVVSCAGGRSDNTLVAWYSSATSNASFIWIAPDEDVGPLHFVGTIFADVGSYRSNVTSTIIRKGFAPINMTECGNTKGCFRYYTGGAANANCDAQTCDYVLTYHVTGNTAHFEMSASAGWVAVGFSSDDRMGGDDVLMCIRTRGGGAAVRNYFNNLGGAMPSLNRQNPLSDEQWEVTGDPLGNYGRLSCRFSRPLKVKNEENCVDLSNTWYQLYAWGSVSHSDTITRHTLEKPPTSSQKITLRVKRNEIVSGAAGAIWRLPTTPFRSSSSFALVVVVMLLSRL